MSMDWIYFLILSYLQMKSNINLCIMPECYIDTNLIETIVPPERIGNTCGYNHKRSCNKVIDEMLGKLKDDFAVGIVDIDKKPLARTTEFKPFVEKQLSGKNFLKLYKHQNKHHYLIFHPPIEQWLLDEAQNTGISLVDYDLPVTLKGLMNETKNEFSKKDPKFKNFFLALLKKNTTGINLLANWIVYLKSHPYNADKMELQGL